MNLDKVHDLQEAYRQVLTAFSFPGRVVSVAGPLSRVDDGLSLPPHLVLPALILLDAETTFSVVTARSSGHSKLIGRLTYARHMPVAESDFIFVAGDGELMLHALADAREGTLEDPHLGATIVMECEVLDSDESGDGISAVADAPGGHEDMREWILAGPGIAGERRIRFSGGKWVPLRAGRNREFPLGIDILMVSPDGRIAALPRTTRMTEAR